MAYRWSYSSAAAKAAQATNSTSDLVTSLAAAILESAIPQGRLSGWGPQPASCAAAGIARSCGCSAAPRARPMWACRARPAAYSYAPSLEA
eukprot:scaffold5824_cov373-Prasinococcus_capsulatus_cf.AAC.6